MHLYSAPGIPNPRIVEMVIHEKQLDIAKTIIDHQSGENRNADFLAKNPVGQLPALMLDNGMVLAEVTAIAEYLEEICPSPFLIGQTAEQRAETRMWVRRIDLAILEPMALAFRYGMGKKYFETRVTVYPDAAESMKAKAQEGLVWLDEMLAGKQYICGDRLTLADIMLYCYVDFFKKTGQTVEDGLVHLGNLLANMADRESARATK